MRALDLAGNSKTPSRAVALAQWSRALAVLLFVASAAALIIQFSWQPALLRRFGNDAELMTILIWAFGLGVGGLIGGLLSQRSPLLLLAGFAAMHGACGYVWPITNESADGWALAVASVLASALLTGAMLPVALGPLIRRTGSAGSAFGDGLFAVMLGAAVACLVSVSVLRSLFGDWAAPGIAIALDAIVVVGALATHWRMRRSALLIDSILPQRLPLIALRRALVLAAAAGALAMSYVLFFACAVSFATAPSQPAFLATLAAFLLGLAAGARRAGRHCALFSAEELMRRAARNAMAANLIGLIALPLIDQLAWLDRAVIVVAMLLCVLIARACGALLPYLAELAITTDAPAGWRSALLCVAYLTGAAAGAWVTGQVLIAQFGFVTIGTGLVIAGVLYTLLLVALLDLPRWQKVVRGVTAAAVAILALALLPRWSPDVVEKIQAKAAADAKPSMGIERDRTAANTLPRRR
jgi:spermidine synthase